MRTWGIAGFASEVDSKCLRACKSELLEEESGGCGGCVGVPIELLVGLSCALPRRISEGKNTRSPGWRLERRYILAACWCVGPNRSGEWGWSLRKNRRIIGPIEPWGQIAQICSRTLFAWRVRRTSSRVMVSEVTVPPPILVNFLFSASCRHLTAAAVYVDMSIESGVEEGSGE